MNIDNNYFLVGSSILFILIGGSIFFYYYIKNEYKEYCNRKDSEEYVDDLKKKIKEGLKYFKDNYDSSVYSNIKIKTDFCYKLIDNKSLEEKKKYFKRLFDMLYETGVRLKTNYDDVVYITNPLNNLKSDLVEEHLDYLKEHSDEEI